MSVVSVPATSVGTNNGWIDSGITLGACTSLTVVASNRWTWAAGQTAAADGSPGSGFPTPTAGVPVFGLITFLYPDGSTPPNQPVSGTPGPTGGVYAASANVANVCTTTYSAATLAAGSPVAATSWRVWYRIADTDLADNAGSISVATTTAADGSVPPAPAGAGSFALDSSNCGVAVTITWSSVVGALSFSVYRDGVLLRNLIDPGTLSYVDSTALVGTSYSYVIRALNACGSTDCTPIVVSPITGLVAPAVSACQPCCRKEAAVSWTAVASPFGLITGYELQRDGVTIATLDPSKLAYVDPDVDFQTTYTWSVRALMGCWSPGPFGYVIKRVRGYGGRAVAATTYSGSAPAGTTYVATPIASTTWGAEDCGFES